VSDRKPAALVLDLTPVREFLEAVDALGVQWADLPRESREPLARLIWLHPSGDMVVYRPPGEDQCLSTK